MERDDDPILVIDSIEQSVIAMDACLERDSRDILALRKRIALLENEISKIYLVLGMMLGCSIAAFVISLLGAMP